MRYYFDKFTESLISCIPFYRCKIILICSVFKTLNSLITVTIIILCSFWKCITARFNCNLSYSAAFFHIIFYPTQFNDFAVPRCKTANEIRSRPMTEKPSNKEIRRYGKREFNRGTNLAGMFLPVPLFAPGFAPLAVDVHTDGQCLCKRERQLRGGGKTSICKILRRTQFLVLHTPVFHLPRCFTLRILAETRLFPHCFILPWCRLNVWTRCHQQQVKLALRISLQTSYEWPKIKETKKNVIIAIGIIREIALYY